LQGAFFGVTVSIYFQSLSVSLQAVYPLGLSNEFTDREAVIEVKSGKLLVVMSSE
jgi:thiamine pyrophosphokinase